MQNVYGVNVACRVYCFMVYWILHQSPPQKGGPNTKLGDHETSKSHNPRFIIYYCLEWPTWIGWWWNSIWLRSRSRMSSHYTWRSVSHDIQFPWYGLWMSSKGPQNFMVTALRHSVERPLVLEMCIVADAETILLNMKSTYFMFLYKNSLACHSVRRNFFKFVNDQEWILRWLDSSEGCVLWWDSLQLSCQLPSSANLGSWR